jgi:hypothetical protein
MIHNSFQLNKKLEKMEQEINELKLKNSELINNVFFKTDKFIELTNRINDLSLDLVNTNDKLEKVLERLENQKTALLNNNNDNNMSDEVKNFIEENNYGHYTDKFKYMGIKRIEDFLILNTYELNENGILYIDAKKIIESAKDSVEAGETMV